MRIIGTTIKAPEGWQWRERHLEVVGDLTATKFDALYAWAKDRSYGLTPTDYREIDGLWIYCVYRVDSDSWATTEKYLGGGTWGLVYRGAYEVISLGQIRAMSRGISYWNVCAYCDRGGLKRTLVKDNGVDNHLCPFCCTPCTAGCGEFVGTYNARRTPESKGRCEACFPTISCVICHTRKSKESCSEYNPRTGTKGQGFICKECAVNITCRECGEIDPRIQKTPEGMQLCKNCFVEKFEKMREPHEIFEEGELSAAGLRLESRPNRPVRVISIETEVNGTPAILSSTLYNCGLVREPFVEAYGTRVPEDSSWPAFLKYDGSVTGGELIAYLLSLDKDDHADALEITLSKMRSLEKLGYVEYAPNCGGHIHIDAHNFSTNNVWRLLTAYNFLEDVIYRLGGAGSAYGHRSLVGGLSREYANATVKGPWGIESNAFNAAAGQNRMTGLNFVPYTNAVNYCRCGKGAENLRGCTCQLPKCTIEWRVWNSTGHPRILHGWLSFMQSLHAWADVAKELTPEEELEYPSLGWTRQPWERTSTAHQKVALERIEWIFSNLVLPEVEKDSLLYAFSKSDIEFPPGFLEALRDIAPPKNRVVKAPRHCFVRNQNIEIRIPAEKVLDSGERRRRR